MRRPRLALPLLALPLALGAAACHEAARSLDDTPGGARAQSDALFSALADRFGPVRLSPELAALRPRLLRAALVPSLVYPLADVWTRVEGPRREIAFAATHEGDAYRMRMAREAPPPVAPGDYLGRLTLEQVAKDDYRWTFREELAVGALSPAGVERAVEALLRAAEAALRGDARALLRESLPRTSAHLGRAFSLDTLAVAPRVQGGVAISLAASLQPERLASTMPGYAAFLDKHVAVLRLGLVELDARGRVWEAGLRDGRVYLRLAAHEGRLVPLAGLPRQDPGRSRLRMELTTRAGLFRLGFEDLVGDLARRAGPDGMRVEMTYRDAPAWQLPFLVEPLLRGSLRRPFEGEGSFLSYSLEPRGGRSSLLVRSYGLTVRESWIVRWLGGRVDATVGAFRAGAESEADRFTRDLLLALRDDIAALQQ
jgi:hypothetical protein